MDAVDRMKRYAFLKTESDKLKNEMEFLNETVLADVESFTATNGAPPVIEGVGSFDIQKPKTWTFSPAYENAADALKQLKADEQADGRATYVEGKTLVFKRAKAE